MGGRENGALAHDLPLTVDVTLSVCEPCLSASGSECHTPGCSFWMHDVPTEDTAEVLRTADEMGSLARCDGLSVGDRVRCWPGFRSGRSYLATALSEPVMFGGTWTIRVRDDDGKSDHIAVTHIERAT